MLTELFCVIIVIAFIFCCLLGFPLGSFRPNKRLTSSIQSECQADQETELIRRLKSAHRQLMLARRKIETLEKEIQDVDEDSNRLQTLNRKLTRRLRKTRDILQSYQLNIINQLSNPITPNSSGDQITALYNNVQQFTTTETGNSNHDNQ